MNIVLVEPEIPPNTGNVIRLCANTGARLHLIEPLGFPLDDAKMRRAGLDYREYAQMHVHRNWDALLETEAPDLTRMFAFTTRGSSAFHSHAFLPGDWFVFGPATTIGATSFTFTWNEPPAVAPNLSETSTVTV